MIQNPIKWFVCKNGSKLKQYEISQIILDMLETKDFITVNEIIDKTECRKGDIQILVKELCSKGLLKRANDLNRTALFSKVTSCLLSDLLTPPSTYKKFKIKSRTVVKRLT